MSTHSDRRVGVETLERRQLFAGNSLLTFAAGLVIGDFGGSRGGIFVCRPDGSDMRQITTSQTDNYQFSGDGLNMPDDHPSFSPDGKQIVFTTSRYQEPGQINNFEIAVMNVDGSNVRRLTFSAGMDTEPVFSPDGKKIAFSSDRIDGKNLDIWVMNVDGTNLVRLTSNPDAETEPAWSHAGDRLAYSRVLFEGVAGLFGSEKNVYVMNADGSGNTLIAGNGFEEHDAVFSLDDKRLIITSEKEHTLPFGNVCTIDIATKQYINDLTVEDSFLHIGGGGDPSLSPDGTKIAYFKSTGGPLLLAGPQTIFVMNANGTGKTKIKAPGIINVHPHFGRLADSDNDGKPDYLDIPTATSLNEFMVQDEARVRAFLGDLTKLETLVGVGRLAARGYFPAHNFNSFQGMGVVFARDINDNDPSEVGRPDVLLYQPDLNGIFGPRDPTDPQPDFPYRLIGWGYGSDYDPANVPTFAGIPADAWLVHEAGFHHIVGGTFEPTAPANDVPRGSKVILTPPDRVLPEPWHERLWDAHFFTNPTGGTPKTAIHDPFGRNLPGFASGENAFFFPQIPYLGHPISGQLVQAEDFDIAKDFGWKDMTAGNAFSQYRLTDVDIGLSTDIAGGFDVSNIQAGEFLRYSLALPSTGLYEFAFRLSNGQSGGRFHVEVDGVNKSGSIPIPVTGTGPKPAYATFVPFSTSLSAGNHAVRIVFETTASGTGKPVRFNSFSVTRPTSPSAALDFIPDIRAVSPSTTISIAYLDNAGIDLGTLGAGDVRVTGPNGFNQIATFVSASPAANGAGAIGTYRLSASGGSWDPSDNGIYTVQPVAKQLTDVKGSFLIVGALGEFTVSVPAFNPGPNLFGEPTTLTINGSDGNDRIAVAQVKDVVTVTINGVVAGTASASSIERIVINALAGNDAVSAESVNVPLTIEGGDGNDTLAGGLKADIIRGGAGNDTAASQPGDLIDLGAGQDGIIIRGTAGDDDLFVSRQSGPNGARLLVRLNGRSFSHAYAHGETVTILGLGGNDQLQFHGDPAQWHVTMDGGTGDDLIVGGDGDDQLIGGDGKDAIVGRAGIDTVSVGDNEQDLVVIDLLDKLISRDRIDRVYRN